MVVHPFQHWDNEGLKTLCLDLHLEFSRSYHKRFQSMIKTILSEVQYNLVIMLSLASIEIDYIVSETVLSGRCVVSLPKIHLPPRSTGNTQEAVALSRHD